MTQTIIQILLLIVSGVAVFTIIVPKFDEIRTVQEETAQYEEALDSAFATNERLSILSRQLDSLSQQERYRLDRFLPTTIDTLGLAYDIETLIDRNGLFLISFDVEDERRLEDPVETTAPITSGGEDDQFAAPAAATQKQLAVQTYSISAAGTYEQFKAFLRDIETSAQLLEVTDMDFASTDSDLNQFAITVEAYGLEPSNPE